MSKEHNESIVHDMIFTEILQREIIVFALRYEILFLTGETVCEGFGCEFPEHSGNSSGSMIQVPFGREMKNDQARA